MFSLVVVNIWAHCSSLSEQIFILNKLIHVFGASFPHYDFIHYIMSHTTEMLALLLQIFHVHRAAIIIGQHSRILKNNLASSNDIYQCTSSPSLACSSSYLNPFACLCIHPCAAATYTTSIVGCQAQALMGKLVTIPSAVFFLFIPQAVII